MRGRLRVTSALRRRDSEPGTRGSLVKGVPEGIDLDTLAKFCLEHFGVALTRVSHIHLSGWKIGGAYRLFLRTKDRKERRLIFKDARYDLDHIPALDGLPLQPGPSEYRLYKQANAALAEYLPAVYHAVEILPGKHYQFILEDLGEDYRRARRAIDTLNIAAAIPALHQVLEEWLPHGGSDEYIRYDREFSFALQDYAIRNLESYSQQGTFSFASEVRQLWGRISEVHGRSEFHELATKAPIHGDLNHSNLYIDNSDPSKIKLVDWEWLGSGLPHADLASMLKGVSAAIEAKVLREFARQSKSLTLEEHKRQYLWCQLERGMLDAGFLAANQMKSTAVPGFDMPLYIELALLQILRAYHELV